MQYFNISKLIRVKINVFEKAIKDILYQQNITKNQHLIFYYLCEIQLAEQNDETHNIKLLTIVKGFKICHHYFEGATYTILVLTNYNNLKKCKRAASN